MSTTQNLSPDQLDELAASLQPTWATLFADIDMAEPAAPGAVPAHAKAAPAPAPAPAPAQAVAPARKPEPRPPKSARRREPVIAQAEPSVRVPTESSPLPKIVMGLAAVAAVVAVIFWVRSGGEDVEETGAPTGGANKPIPAATGAPAEPVEPKGEEPEAAKTEEPEATKTEEPEDTKAEEPEDTKAGEPEDTKTEEPPAEPPPTAKPKDPPKPPPKTPPPPKPKPKPKSGNIVRDVPF